MHTRVLNVSLKLFYFNMALEVSISYYVEFLFQYVVNSNDVILWEWLQLATLQKTGLISAFYRASDRRIFPAKTRYGVLSKRLKMCRRYATSRRFAKRLYAIF